ncbi:5-methylcytosine rRNA methyltransferase NSUN4-like [Anneissia japonica]|uniref:5-methylcytosine rRNA methyltransferase NSUN4-like n=1 Tax=Anneissia japonica TaxID=1529436 RepID=UPI001425BA60|nr:5-methylcytosine rRNA methyltransferase NSUN4-like [Anneissia japonica]
MLRFALLAKLLNRKDGLTFIVHKRWKKKLRWITDSMKSKYEPSQLALKHFDRHYKSQFEEKWPSIRLALLSKQKYGALINNYGNPDEVEERLSELGAKDVLKSIRASLKIQNENIVKKDSTERLDTITAANPLPQNEENEESSNPKDDHQSSPAVYAPKIEYIIPEGFTEQMSQYIVQDQLVDDSDINVDIAVERKTFSVNEQLKCYVFDGSATRRFPPAKFESRTKSLLEYYLMDASSLLPVLCLDLQPGDTVLDMCAGPGGKSVAMLQTMHIGGIICNEVTPSRRRRLQDVLRLYIPKDMLDNEESFRLTGFDGTDWGDMEPDTYDKILVDVPCTTDRLSANENDNNIFHPRRLKEKNQLPPLQTELLMAALRSVKVGGTVVYSTCTMSSEQNERVIQKAVHTCLQTHDIVVTEVDLSPLTRSCDGIFNFHDRAKLGKIVVPNLSANFGPMYFCALKRLR